MASMKKAADVGFVSWSIEANGKAGRRRQKLRGGGRAMGQEDVCKPKPGSEVGEAGDARSTGDESREYRRYEDDASNRDQRVQARASGGSCDRKKRLKAWWRTGRSCSDDETTGCVHLKTMAGTTRPYEERCRSSRGWKGICWNSEMRCDVMRCDACNRMGPGCVRDAVVGPWLSGDVVSEFGSRRLALSCVAWAALDGLTWVSVCRSRRHSGLVGKGLSSGRQ
ncbi:predicted protein [Verticillium alfalfae VaMs.102]|uniref:Predicted protein n=1 Tax=Verticillium alfalfae (strain VaMs.102 / ATCC MYA-4576 / FGSC 10136) TaxID=526221 RepID=C9SJD1_VERA1|nr:predicted protein [Verticillium alfalfae VaMs.102]EEY18293.1 predicted protein [Verticillium alfalfae VaMs.102]